MYQQTSLLSLIETKLEGKVGKQQQLILQLFDEHKTLNDRQITKLSGLEKSSVVARRNELVAQDILIESHKAKCPYTGRLTIFWRKRWL